MGWFLVDLAINVGGWAVAAVKKTEKFYDLLGSVSFLTLTAGSLMLPGPITARKVRQPSTPQTSTPQISTPQTLRPSNLHPSNLLPSYLHPQILRPPIPTGPDLGDGGHLGRQARLLSRQQGPQGRVRLALRRRQGAAAHVPLLLGDAGESPHALAGNSSQEERYTGSLSRSSSAVSLPLLLSASLSFPPSSLPPPPLPPPRSLASAQAAWVFVTLSPVLIVNGAKATTPLGLLDLLGKHPPGLGSPHPLTHPLFFSPLITQLTHTLLSHTLPLSTGVSIYAAGLGFEVVADRQKDAFRSKPENKGQFITEGLWSISRHPNYFGEALLWWGVFFTAARSFTSTAQLASVASPLFVFLLVRRVVWGGDRFLT
jgi:hypothetical protein